MLILLIWNLLGWWVYPVTISLLSHEAKGEACGNGALVCYCKATDQEKCFCSVLPSQESSWVRPL